MLAYNNFRTVEAERVSSEITNTPRSDANRCFVCGPDNPTGMRVRFRLENGMCKAEYTPKSDQCGYDGITHGGVLFSLLDDVMANWLFLQGERAYTAKCEIRYREPAATGIPIALEGELTGRRGRYANMTGRALDASSGRLLAEATATFMVIAE